MDEIPWKILLGIEFTAENPLENLKKSFFGLGASSTMSADYSWILLEIDSRILTDVPNVNSPNFLYDVPSGAFYGIS